MAKQRALIVGLGNPGREYQHNRHNIGFQIADHLAQRHGLAFSRKQNNAQIAIGTIDGRPVVLAKPQSYMNLSGIPIAGLLRFYRVDLAHLLVIFDDIDLPIGTIRLKPSGSSGGQNGMKSIIERLGSQEFARLRAGIGRPRGRKGAAGHVLKNFTPIEAKIIREVYDRACDATEIWLSDGILVAMSRHNAPASSETTRKVDDK